MVSIQRLTYNHRDVEVEPLNEYGTGRDIDMMTDEELRCELARLRVLIGEYEHGPRRNDQTFRRRYVLCGEQMGVGLGGC